MVFATSFLAYKTPEVIEPLTVKLKSAEALLKSLQDDPKLTAKRTAVIGVNTAGLYNWEVVRRREQRAGEAIVHRPGNALRKLHRPLRVTVLLVW